MTTRVKITKGQHKGKVARVVGVYTDGRTDVKIGRKYYTINSGEYFYID